MINSGRILIFLLFVKGALAVSAQSCPGLLPQQCLAPGVNCKYDFTNNVCVAPTSNPDSCQAFSTQGLCPSSCFWDPYLNRCLINLFVIQNVLGCPYWSTAPYLQADQYGGGTISPACNFHGCNFNTANSLCTQPTSSGNIAYPQPSTVSAYTNYIYFLNPTVVQNSLTVGVTVATLIQQSVTSPQWPQIAVLVAQSNLTSIYNTQNTTCSSYSNAASSGPVPFMSSNYPASAASIQSSFSNTFQFANDNSTGTYLQKLLGYASVAQNSQYLVKSVSSDGTYIYWTLSFDLTQLMLNCQNRGASMSTTPTGRTYFVPISLIDRTPTGYYQSTQNFYINVPTTGSITISDTSVYKLRSYIVESTFQQSNCPSGQVKQFLTWEFDVRDQFDPSKQVGPRLASDIFLRNPQNNLLATCYGETISNFNFLGCSIATATCAYQFQTASRCRSITADGNAFNFCNNSASADRIADLGSDLMYPTAMDGYHSLWVNSYACTANTSPLSGCVLANQNSNNFPDQIQATIKDSVYNSAVTINANPFQVFAGFLPFPTAGISTFQPLTSTNGTANATQFFDGNIFVGQPITPIIYLTSQLQSTVDLRMLIAQSNMTIYALDSLGNRMTNAAVNKLDFATLQTSLLYVPKNLYDNSATCGNTGQFCQKLPACSGILGCDGVSFSSVILKQYMPAVGYQFVIQFAEVLPYTTGRMLLSYNEDDNSALDPNMYPNGEANGRISFTIRLIDRSTNETHNVDVADNDGFFYESTHSRAVNQSFLRAVLSYWLSQLILSLLGIMFVVKFARLDYELEPPQLLPVLKKKHNKKFVSFDDEI